MRKRCLALSVVFAIALNLFCTLDAFAADSRLAEIWFDMDYSDIVTVSLDVKVTQPDSFGMEFTAPKNLDTPKDLNNKTGCGMVRIANGKIFFRSNGLWIAPGQEEQSGITSYDFEQDQWHRLKLKYKRKTGETQWYLDDEYMGMSNLASTGYPINCVSLYGDSSVNGKCQVANVSVMGINIGELGVVMLTPDFENKILRFEFSEDLSDKSVLEQAVLRKANTTDGVSEIPLTLNKGSQNEAEFTYTDNLEAGSEYVLILPSNLTGESESILTQDIFYFTTETSVEETALTDVNYNNGDTSGCWIPAIPASCPILVDTGDDHEKALNVPAMNTGAFQYIWQDIIIPEGNTSAISFDILPMKSDMTMGIEIRAKENVNPITVVFGKGGYILLMSGWTNAGWLNLGKHPFTGSNAWANSNWIADYNTEDWINFRLQFDKISREAQIYVDNTLVKTLKGTQISNKYEFGAVAFRTPSSPNANTGEQLMLLDNVKTLEYIKKPTVGSVRFNDVEGNGTGVFDTMSRLLESVEVTFTSEMDEQTLDESTVQLLYNDIPIKYEAVYDDKAYTYKITPLKLPGAGDEVKIHVSGAMDNLGEEAKEFTSYAMTDNLSDMFNVKEFRLISSTGQSTEELGDDIYVKTAIYNTTDEPKNLIVSLASYADNAIMGFDFKKIRLNANSMFVADCDKNAIMLDSVNAQSVIASIQDADTGVPIIDSIEITDTKQEGSTLLFGQKKSSVRPGANIIVEVFADGTDYDDILASDDFRKVLLYKTQITADDKGGYLVAFDIGSANVLSGMYVAKAYSQGYEYSQRGLYVNPIKAKEIYRDILKPAVDSKDADNVKNAMLNNQFDLGIDDRCIDADVAERAAELILNFAEENTLSENNASKILNIAVGIAALEQGKITDIIIENPDIFDLDNSKIKNLYNRSFINDTTSEYVYKKLKDKNFSNIDDFYSKLNDAFILAVVKNPVEPNSIMTVLDEFGIYADTAEQYKNVEGKEYASVDDLKTALDSYKPSSGGSSGSGGKKGTFYVPTEVITTGTSDNTPSNSDSYFEDIENVPWAKQAINALFEKQIINGKSDKVFSPMDNIKREEFTKMLVCAFSVNADSADMKFFDVPYGAWYYDYVKRAYGAGLINGFSNEVFGTGDNITRQDMALMIYRAANYAGAKIQKSEEKRLFIDDADISDYAYESVYALKNAGVISGNENGWFNPAAYATRAQAAKMLYGVIEK